MSTDPAGIPAMTSTSTGYRLFPADYGLRPRPRPAHRAVMDADAAMANHLAAALSLPDWHGKHHAPITTATARLAEIRAEATS